MEGTSRINFVLAMIYSDVIIVRGGHSYSSFFKRQSLTYTSYGNGEGTRVLNTMKRTPGLFIHFYTGSFGSPSLIYYDYIKTKQVSRYFRRILMSERSY